MKNRPFALSSNLCGIILMPDNKGIIKKRYRAVKVGNDYLVHKKTYKRICRSQKALNRIAKRITVWGELPSLDIDWLAKPSFFDNSFFTA